ncbi:MAG: tRNA pseudouridine(38-40) synthase TruA [Bacteroidales bacterium]
MKNRYFIFLSYRGTSYHGWQVQPNSITVQELLEKALSTILGEEISATGAGRTDTGVHAAVFCAHFDSLHEDLAYRKNLVFRINKFLPGDIAVSAIRKVNPEANARFSAISRTYTYYISRVKDPFSEESAWFIHGDLDISAMNEAASILKKYTDFTSFSKLHTDVKTNNCRIMDARWEDSGDRIIFRIKADRFLRNMVRAIVGTVVDVGFHKISLDEYVSVIESLDRCRAGKSAPAKGLFLTEIEYPEEIFV